MTPQCALLELLQRLGATQGALILIDEAELSQWPSTAVAAMKSQHLIVKGRPAASAICPGCERECVMPVHTLPATTGSPAAFIVCDKRSDINRVMVPMKALEQWHASGDSVAGLVADLLALQRPEVSEPNAARWEIGLFRGQVHASHIVLKADGALTLALAGHSIALEEVIELEDDRLSIDARRLTRLVDSPVSGGGDAESYAQRRARLKKRVREVKALGIRGFLRSVAAEERISVSRLKQLLTD